MGSVGVTKRPCPGAAALDRQQAGVIYSNVAMEWRTYSDEETRALGRAIGERLGPGATVCLTGPLGAGKTTMAQGIAQGLGVEEVVNSPTFTLAQEYAGAHRLFHLDVYRLRGPEEAEDLALEELQAAGGVLMIEWPERIAPRLPDDRLEVRLEPEDDARRLIVTAHGPRASAVLAQVESELMEPQRHEQHEEEQG